MATATNGAVINGNGAINQQKVDELITVAKDYYDSGDAFNFYLELWGGDLIHIGLYDESILSKHPETSVEQVRAASQHSLEHLMSLIPKEALPEGGEVADLGAAYGGAARQIAKEFNCKVHCVDISAKECEHNAEMTKKAGMTDKIVIHERSFTDTGIPDASIDVALSQDSIVHAGYDGRAKVLKEVARILKPGGYFIFTDIMQNADVTAEQLKHVLKRIHLDSMGSVPEYKGFAEAAGLKFVTFEDVSPMVGKHYGTIQTILTEKRSTLNLSETYVDNMLQGLGHWVDNSQKKNLQYGYWAFQKPL